MRHFYSVKTRHYNFAPTDSVYTMYVMLNACRPWPSKSAYVCEERAFVSLEKVRTAHARMLRNFYSDFTAKRFVPSQSNKRRQLTISLENSHGTQPATGKLLHGVCVFARAACFVPQQLNVKLPTRAEERVADGIGGYKAAPDVA